MASRPSDILVVGAGIVGCAVAHELARRGASVDIVDERPVAMGATQASAGVLAPYIEAREGSPLLELTVRSLALFDDFVARAASDSGVAVMYRRNGTIDVGMNQAEMASLQKTADVLGRRGVPALMLDAATVRAEEPQLADGAAGGLLIETHGVVGRFQGRARRAAAGDGRQSTGDRRVARGAARDVRDGALPQRRAPRAADGAARGRRDARRAPRPAARDRLAGAVR